MADFSKRQVRDVLRACPIKGDTTLHAISERTGIPEEIAKQIIQLASGDQLVRVYVSFHEHGVGSYVRLPPGTSYVAELTVELASEELAARIREVQGKITPLDETIDAYHDQPTDKKTWRRPGPVPLNETLERGLLVSQLEGLTEAWKILTGEDWSGEQPKSASSIE